MNNPIQNNVYLTLLKLATSNATSSAIKYETVPKEHWSTPQWINQTTYMDSLDYLGTIGVGKGWMLSYRNMCRWNSGFFYKHPALKNYDFYWRIEPDVYRSTRYSTRMLKR